MNIQDFYDPILETMPASDRQEYLNQQLQHITRFAYAYAPAMKEKRVGRYQLDVTRSNQRDFLTLTAELQENATREGLAAALSQGFQDACGLKLDRVNFVASGTIPAQAKTLIDERKWE